METEDIYSPNWCPECGEPRNICTCKQYETAQPELSVCPFCGTKPKTVKWEPGGIPEEFANRVYCPNDKCPIGGHPEDVVTFTVSAWEKRSDTFSILNHALEAAVDRLNKALRWIDPKTELPPDCSTVEFVFYRYFAQEEFGHGYVTTNPPLDPEWCLVANGHAEILKPYQHVVRWRPV